ncbi:bifunctional polysaccharide deacetylase/glycosyltransferase family 2 protein [Streptacidiphilus jiangxiensis]|uniref:Glycosyltransferase, catalytic subunit of cellulose synthase and poly-beta-1,6-N-acetylglucosamine synthase n=1 Tax=Streptacidiphilus jiangxiensis TaxID=235985 RepID=A0A1H7J502_STRJI|nr:glycosyltransferase [Streptacidiphilus jiangxiensis]SEK69748.1 Glycosyltransferase, catalytic subunit of cellulose synthase and poly-beta-1,6-N-acetylglucosamine synthase [Streptacidiphilus jiangxiensis]
MSKDSSPSRSGRARRGRRGAVRQVPLRTHWLLLGTLVVTLTLALLIEGYTQHMFGSTPDGAGMVQGPSGAVPSAVSNGGPVISPQGGAGGAPRTARPRPGTVALTFDDGPSAQWTPQILEVLRKHGVHATFFVIGENVTANPGVTAQIVADGNELGVHTFTHPNLGLIPAWQRTLQLREAQLAIAGATGDTTTLLRPPYSSGNDSVDDADWTAIQQAGREGYLTVLTTQDTEDWQRPGVEKIISNGAVPGTVPGVRVNPRKLPAGQVVLMHDAGGDRSQSVAALDQLLTEYQQEGLTVGTVSATTGLSAPMTKASATDHWMGLALIWVLLLSHWLLTVIGWFMIAAGVLSVLRAVVSVIAARRHKRMAQHGWGEPVTEPATVIVPAYNESAGIEAAVRSLVAQDHPVEILVVDDGSSDGTADIAESLGLPGVRVIRKENGGKPSALNTGIANSSFDLLVMVDGDTVFEPDAVRKLIQPFADPEVGAVSGNAKVVNRGGLLGRWQHIEYVVGFNLDRRLFDLAECMPTVPGAVGGFRKEALMRVGGLAEDTLAEDTDLTMALCRDGWRVVYEEGAVAWTEAPASLGALWKQRYRWCYGTMQAMWKHRGAMLQRGPAGKLGRRGLGYLLLFQVLLPLLAPVVDIFALYGLVFLDPLHVIGLWLGFMLLQLGMGLYAFRLDGESPGPLWSLPLQQFVYRQLMYLVVIQSTVTAVAGARLRWQRMERYGSLQAPTGLGAPVAGYTGYTAGVQLTNIPIPSQHQAGPPLADSWLAEAARADHSAYAYEQPNYPYTAYDYRDERPADPGDRRV